MVLIIHFIMKVKNIILFLGNVGTQSLTDLCGLVYIPAFPAILLSSDKSLVFTVKIFYLYSSRWHLVDDKY